MAQTPSSPHPIDLFVGGRVRLRRTSLKLSQEKLALKLGITFQQVQKYERGLNRISASRLYEIAQALDVSITYFFQDMESTALSGEALTAADFDDTTMRLALMVSNLPPQQKRAVLMLVRQLLTDKEPDVSDEDLMAIA